MQAARRAVQSEYLRRVCEAILGHPSLQELEGPDTAILLCQHAHAVTLMDRWVAAAVRILRLVLGVLAVSDGSMYVHSQAHTKLRTPHIF